MSNYKIIIFVITIIFSQQPLAYGNLNPPEGWKQIEVFKESNPEPKSLDVDKVSGFIPYARNYVDPVYTNSRPHKSEITDTFRITLARGEFEPVIVALYGVRTVENVSLIVKDLKSQQAQLATNQFEIRRIDSRAVSPSKKERKKKKFKIIPSILTKTNKGDIKKGRTTAFWLTFHALKENDPGAYKGQLVVSSHDKIVRILKIEVTILPLVLEDVPDRLYSTLYTPSRLDKEMERNARTLLKDMRAHGMNSFSPLIPAWGEPLTFDRRGQGKITNLVNHLIWAKEEGFWKPSIVNVNKLIRTSKPQNDANYTKFEENVDIPNLKKLVATLEKKRKKYDLPEIIYLPIDEPGSFTDKAGSKREEIAVLVLKALTEMKVRGATTVADMVDNKHRKLPRWKNVAGWWEKIRPYCSVRIYFNGYPEGETSLAHEMKDARERGHEVMLYENTSTMGIDPRVSRMYFGFYGARTGVKGITSWTHPTLGSSTVLNVWSDWREKRAARRAYRDNKEWELPPSTVNWEMVREGIDDAKYLHLFKKLLKENSGTNRKYINLLKDINHAIDNTEMSQKKAKCNWDGRRFASFRENLRKAILEMQSK